MSYMQLFNVWDNWITWCIDFNAKKLKGSTKRAIRVMFVINNKTHVKPLF